MKTALEIEEVFQAPQMIGPYTFHEKSILVVIGDKNSGKVICETCVLGEEGIMEKSEVKQKDYIFMMKKRLVDRVNKQKLEKIK